MNFATRAVIFTLLLQQIAFLTIDKNGEEGIRSNGEKVESYFSPFTTSRMTYPIGSPGQLAKPGMQVLSEG